MCNSDTDDTESSVHECPSCERSFDTYRGVKVHHSRSHGESISGEPVECTYCGTEKRVQRSKAEQQKFFFCDKECEGAYYAENHTGSDAPAWKGGKITTECANCGVEFDLIRAKYEYYEQHYCSSECMGEHYETRWKGENNPQYDRRVVECEHCGGDVVRKPAQLEYRNRHFCDRECWGEWVSRNFVGEDAPNWRGGRVEYYGPSWYQQREEALERDGRQCVICGKGKEEIGRSPDVHHIVPVRCFDEKDSAHQLGNLITLCREHHFKAERGSIETPMPQSPLTPQLADD